MDLPVLIPRVKKRPSPRDPRGVVRETTPSNANKRRCRAGRVRLCPLPTFSGRFRCSGRVTAAKPPKEKRGGFGANKFARNPAALFLPAPSVLNRPCFGFELRARADSPRFRGSLPAFAGEATCGRSCGGAGRGDAEAGTLKVARRTDQQTASSSRGGWRPLRARRTPGSPPFGLAFGEGDTRASATLASLGAFRPAFCYNKSMKQILFSSSRFGAEPHIDYRACANFGPLYATNR